jgi:C1A family cysteine protease
MNFAQVSQNLAAIKQALTQRPVVAGIMLYDSFESDTVASTGTVNLPTPQESLLGGHAVALVGYDDRPIVNGRTNPNYQRFTVRNSWGPTWGQSGYFTIPYSYVLNPNLAMDFWTVTKMS